MYIAFTEEQAQEIRSTGISVIEWKRCICNNVNVAICVINKISEEIEQALTKIVDYLNDFIDMLDFIVEEIKEKFHYPVSRRYKFVKVIGAMGYDKQRVWTLTRHTWLARSNI